MKIQSSIVEKSSTLIESRRFPHHDGMVFEQIHRKKFVIVMRIATSQNILPLLYYVVVFNVEDVAGAGIEI